MNRNSTPLNRTNETTKWYASALAETYVKEKDGITYLLGYRFRSCLLPRAGERLVRFKWNRTRKEVEQRVRPDRPEQLKKPGWNYEPCAATRGIVTLGEPARETYWWAPIKGKRVIALHIRQYNNEFYIYDGDYSGTRKVNDGGGPENLHYGITIDEKDGFYDID